MVDFNVNLAAPQASGTQVLQPVRDARTDFPNPWIGVVAGVAGGLLNNAAEQKKKEKELQQQAILSDFTRSQTAINDGISQGMPLAKAGVLARSNFSKWAAQYPQHATEFAKINKSLFDYTDLGEAKDEVQLFKDQRKADIAAAVASGAPIDSATSPEVVDAYLKAHQVKRQAESEFAAMTKRTSENRSANAEERAAFEFRNRQESVKLLSSIGDANLPAAFGKVNDILSQFRSTGDVNASRAQIIQTFQGIESALTSASALHPELAKPYQALFAEMKQYGLETIEGKATSTASENKLKELKTRIELTALASPENKAIFGQSKVFNGQVPATFYETNAAARTSLAKLMTVFGSAAPTVVGDPAVETPTFDVIKSQVAAIESGRVTDVEGTKTAISTGANNVLHQIGRAASTGLDPKQLTTSFNFIASPEYAKLVAYGKIDKEANAAANKVFSVMYEDAIAKSLEGRLAEPFRSGGKRKDMSYGSIVDFKWNGSKIVAEASKGIWMAPDEAHDRDHFVQQMDTNTKVINQLIKAGTHMEGHTDYNKYWEENKHRILPSVYPDPARLKVGQVVDGYKYIGGNVKSKSNWIQEKSNPNEDTASKSAGKSSFKVEERNPYPSEDSYFKANPQVAGMAAEDNRVVMNPYSTLKPEEKDSVRLNETARIFMRTNEKPSFQLTPEQESYLATTSYKNASLDDKLQTVAARILSGDPSIKNPTKEQLDYVKKLKERMGK